MSAPAVSDEPWLELDVRVAPPLRFGAGEGFERRCVPILGGTVSGRIAGEVVEGGSDWQRILPDGTSELAAHYAIRTDAGELVEVHSNGLRSGPPEAMMALLAGAPIDPSLIYFRSAIRMLTGAPRLRELTTRLFVGVGVREPDRVRLAVHALL